MDNGSIEHMSVDELTNTIDSFLTFMGMDISNITMKKRKKILKKAIENLQLDNYYVEYCLSECTNKDKIAELINRMNATNMVIVEIRKYLQYLPVENKTLLKKYETIKRRIYGRK